MQQDIIQRVSEAIPDATIDVAIDGNRAVIDVVSTHFADMSRVKKQQAVYACIADLIADGSLHAVTIHASVPPSA